VEGVSHRLRTAMLRAQLDPAALAAAVGVDIKTVNRWLAGRVPHQRTRLAVADTLGETEAALWPQTRPDQALGGEATAEVVGAWAHRAEIPGHLWTGLLSGATKRIDLLGEFGIAIDRGIVTYYKPDNPMGHFNNQRGVLIPE
jgi:transcriptional regulator with XRE-family HTH domain